MHGKPTGLRPLRSEIICNLPLSPHDPWTSVLLTGNLASVDPKLAFDARRAKDSSKTKHFGCFLVHLDAHCT